MIITISSPNAISQTSTPKEPPLMTHQCFGISSVWSDKIGHQLTCLIITYARAHLYHLRLITTMMASRHRSCWPSSCHHFTANWGSPFVAIAVPLQVSGRRVLEFRYEFNANADLNPRNKFRIIIAARWSIFRHHSYQWSDYHDQYNYCSLTTALAMI